MKKKIIIAAALVVVMMAAFTISSFATDISTEETIYVDNNEYYLMRWYNNPGANFRIYVPHFQNNSKFGFYGYVDSVSPIFIDDIGYVVNTEDHMDVKLNNLSNIAGFMFSSNQFCVINSLIYTFNNELFEVDDSGYFHNQSKLFNNITILEAFNKGYYALNSNGIDSTLNDDFHDYITNINNGTLVYYDVGFDFFVGSLKDAFNYTSYLTSDYYDIDDNLISHNCYIGYTQMFRDKLCYSLFNLLYYELGITDIEWNDVTESVWYNMYYGSNGSYVGQLIELSSTNATNNGQYVMSGRISRPVSYIDGPTAVVRFINGLEYSNVLSYLEPFAEYIAPVTTIVVTLFTVTLFIAGKKVIFQ